METARIYRDSDGKADAESKPATVADCGQFRNRQQAVGRIAVTPFNAVATSPVAKNPRFRIDESPCPVQHGMHVLTPSLQVQIAHAIGTRHVQRYIHAYLLSTQSMRARVSDGKPTE